MKNVFFVLMGIIVISAPAKAQDAAEAESIKQCVGVMLGNEKMTREKAEYACKNPFLDPQSTDSQAQEKMRQDLAEDFDQAKSDSRYDQQN